MGLGGSIGRTDLRPVAFALVHNRLLSLLVMTDHAGFVGIYHLIRQAAAQARKRGYFAPVTPFAVPEPEPRRATRPPNRLRRQRRSAPRDAPGCRPSRFWSR